MSNTASNLAPSVNEWKPTKEPFSQSFTYIIPNRLKKYATIQIESQFERNRSIFYVWIDIPRLSLVYGKNQMLYYNYFWGIRWYSVLNREISLCVHTACLSEMERGVAKCDRTRIVRDVCFLSQASLQGAPRDPGYTSAADGPMWHRQVPNAWFKDDVW